MIRLIAALCLLMLSALYFTPQLASGEYVIELPILTAIRAHNKGLFEMLMIWWDQKPTPALVQLQPIIGV